METRQTKLIRHQVAITQFPKRVTDLVRELQDLVKEARPGEPDNVMIGFQSYDPIATGDALVIQWDEQILSADDDQDDVERREAENATHG